MSMLVFRFVTLCGFVSRCQHFGETNCLHLQCLRWKQYASPKPENQHRHLHRRENLKSHIVNLYGEATIHSLSTFNPENVCVSETLVSTYKSTRRYNPKDQQWHFVTGWIFPIKDCYTLTVSKLKGHTITAVGNCLFRILAAATHICRPLSSIRNIRTRDLLNTSL
jgi:hypothetical protein